MPITDPDGRLTPQGESILVRAFGRAFCAASVRATESEPSVDDAIVQAAQVLNAETT